MSMNAEFVAVSAEELARIIEDDAAIEDLFMPDVFATGSRTSRRTLSLDKAWHGVHYLLTGEAMSNSGAVLGGTEIGEDMGYGPVRYFTVADVSQLAAGLERNDLDNEIAARYQPDEMSRLSIYPGGWNDHESRDWLLESVGELRTFFHDAAANGDAIVTCLV